ncbi:MAG TPA: hypothetical protein GX500_07190 [Firmicutes bacterium]|nr:hypothetical protein [Candidatus Fermentithermobacillaceae bacterium]
MSIIDDMMHIIMKNPNATARDIARELGYAEEKSVYYWLGKSGYRGLRDFKLAVLRRAPREMGAGTEKPAYVRESSGSQLRLYSEDEGTVLPASLWEHILRQAGPQSYGVLLTKSEYPPLVSRGDVLIVDPEAPFFQGDLAWVSVKGSKRLVRRYGRADDQDVFVDAIRPGLVLVPDSVDGKVVLILKSP